MKLNDDWSDSELMSGKCGLVHVDCLGDTGIVVTRNKNSMRMSGYAAAPEPTKEKIPRPPNAFMIFANEWRRKLAIQFSNESNKEISVRLGIMWKNLQSQQKVWALDLNCL